jgi:hypothetical protein
MVWEPRMKKPVIGICRAIALIFIFLSSCASTARYARLDDSVGQGNFSDGIALMDKGKRSLYSNREAVLYYLDKGMLLHYAKQYEDSSALLEDGERAIEAAFTKSITMEIGTYILNDNTREYAGEDYEDIYMNSFNALNYYHRGELDEALVEVRRMNNKIQYLSAKYGVILSNLQKKALDDTGQIPKNPNAGTKFTDSALARYLGMIFYRGAGRYDDARIDYQGLRTAFANTPGVYKYPVPSSLAGDLEIPAGKARLNVIAFSGLSPVKEQVVERLPLPGGGWIKIAVPIMVSRPSAVRRITLVFDNGEHHDLELLEDIGAVAQETFKNRQNIIYLKTSIRAAIKALSSTALYAAAEDEKVSEDASLLLSLFGFFAQIFAEASEQADTRISRYFPSKAWVAGLNLAPGMYSFQVKYYGSSGKELASVQYENMRVRENTLNLAEAICLK